MTFCLRIIVLLDYEDGMQQFFLKPSVPETELVSESLSLAPMANYHFRVTFFHEDLVSGTWILHHLQLTLLTMSILIQINTVVGHAGFVCLGPEDPYENTPYYADAPQYWLPASLLGNTAYFQWLMTLSVRVSQCPIWAFTTSDHIIQYLVAKILS